jgi:hypothetical protein
MKINLESKLKPFKKNKNKNKNCGPSPHPGLS